MSRESAQFQTHPPMFTLAKQEAAINCWMPRAKLGHMGTALHRFTRSRSQDSSREVSISSPTWANVNP